MLLICEGLCNPDLAACDAAVKAERAAETYSHGPMSPVSEGLVSRLRRLVHTPHGVLGDSALCLVCGTKRRWGMST